MPSKKIKKDSSSKKTNKKVKLTKENNIKDNVDSTSQDKLETTEPSKRKFLPVLAKKFILGSSICILSAMTGAGIAYGVITTINSSNSSQVTSNSIELTSASISLNTLESNSETYTISSESYPTLNNYVNKNNNYLTLSLIFSKLQIQNIKASSIAKDSIYFNLTLVSNVANAEPLTIPFKLIYDTITFPSGSSTLSFTNLVFSLNVTVADNGTISIYSGEDSVTPTVRVGNISTT